MKQADSNTQAFYELLRAGLWEREARLSSYGKVNFNEVLRLAQEQSVLGLVTSGFDHVVDVMMPYETRLMFVGSVSEIEQRNKAMNQFVAELGEKMRIEGIKAVLVKGQGVAQCYEKPLWRSAGDIDFLLDNENYEKAKAFLCPLANKVETEDKRVLHLGIIIEPWIVELHGTMHNGISKRINAVVDKVQDDIFEQCGVRCWDNNGVELLLPNPDNDVILVFAHFVGHFYGHGIGIRQVCDWCRLLWHYSGQLDLDMLYDRIREMGLLTEWKGFAAFAVEYLGMPAEFMPFYEASAVYYKKAARMRRLMMETGNLGHNKEEEYRLKYSRMMVNIVTFFIRFGEFARIATIFPVNSPKFFATYVFGKLKKDAALIQKWV